MKKYTFGILITTLIGLFALILQNAPAIKEMHLSTVIIAILLGMLIKNTVGVKQKMEIGIKFCSKKVLRFSIILLGFKLSLTEVAKLGLNGVLMVGIIVFATFFFTKWMGQKLMLSKNLSTLIAGGTSICGAAAVIAISALKNDENEEDATFAIGVVTIFGTLFMFLYPLLYKFLNLNIADFAFWAGSSIHEVAQVVAAGFAVSNEAGVSATLVKLTRVLYLIPLTLGLSLIYCRRNSKKFDIKDVQIPHFVLYFIGAIFINSIFQIPPHILNAINQIGLYLMTIAMAGLGLETSFANMKKSGLKPIYLGVISSIFISVLSLSLIFAFKI